jgi:MFS transporter, DHA2 family, metal-tetracycline-proton antiporter
VRAPNPTAAGPTAPGHVAAPWLALLAAPLSFGIGAPALVLPDIARDTGTAVASATWVVTAFGGGIALGTPLLAGLLAHRGGRATLAACAALVALGVALVCVLPVLAVVALGTALQGLGTAGLLACAMTLADRPRTLGLISAGLATVGATGPLVGSLVGDLAGWRAALALPALGLLAIPAVIGRAGRGGTDAAPFDGVGAVLLTALVTALVAVPHRPVPALLAATVVAAALGVHLRRRPDGFLPAVLVRSPAFLLASGTALLLAIVNFGLFYAAPTLLTRQAGWTPAAVGAVMLWPYLLGGALSWAVVAATARLGLRTVAACLVATVVVAALLAWSVAAVPILLVAFAAGSVAAAAGQGALARHAAEAAPGPYRSPAIGLFNLCYLLGTAFGPAIVALILMP